MKTIKDLIAAFTTNPHVLALKNLMDKNGDGKIDGKDLAAEAARIKAELEARQASYYHAAGVAIATFAAGVYVGHRYWT